MELKSQERQRGKALTWYHQDTFILELYVRSTVKHGDFGLASAVISGLTDDDFPVYRKAVILVSRGCQWWWWKHKLWVSSAPRTYAWSLPQDPPPPIGICIQFCLLFDDIEFKHGRLIIITRYKLSHKIYHTQKLLSSFLTCGRWNISNWLYPVGMYLFALIRLFFAQICYFSDAKSALMAIEF